VTPASRWRQWLPDFVLLGLIWGSSFLFMRLTSHEFGSWSTAWLRVSVAWLTLLPFLLWQGQVGSLRQHWRRILPMGVVNSGIPFICYASAVMYISTGMSSILNSTTPLFGALIAWVWLKQRPGRSRGLGLLLGFAGAALLALTLPGGISFKAGGSGWAVLACLVATTCYGLSTHYSQRYLSGVPTMTIAAGSQIGASLALLIPGIWFWPSAWPSDSAWWSLLMIGVVCTGLAYVLYFRLIAKVGAARTMTVTYLIPLFANLIGIFFLDELITTWVIVCAAMILSGTALAVGLLKLPD
jgi:drug/metabolite transporter (DMT)-like permease